MIPRLDIQFPFRRQWNYWFGKPYEPKHGEYLLNHARSGIVLALRASLPNGGRVGVVTYNCHTIVNAVVNAGCTPVFVDVTDGLTIDIESVPAELDAIVVTNLLGIRNDISAIRAKCPQAIIIVDNAHGYGLPAEGDFTVYSINQGKFPALGEGGILIVNSAICNSQSSIEAMYSQLPSYGFIAQVKLFCSMLIKAMAYSRCFYWLTRLLKRELGASGFEISGKVSMRKMAPGIRRLYNAWLPSAEEAIVAQKRNAEAICNLQSSSFNLQSSIPNSQYIIGSNAFMLIARCENPEELKKWFAARGVETATHFAHAIDWATEFGYLPGSCPKAEELTKHLLMIPTYVGSNH